MPARPLPARALWAGLVLLPACADGGLDTGAAEPADLADATARWHGQQVSLAELLASGAPARCVEVAAGDFDCAAEAAPPPGGEYCTLYQHSSYGGASATFVTGADYNSLGSIGWNDRASSLRCGNGGQLQLFEHNNYAGSSTAWTGGEVSYLGVFNDKASSVKFTW